MSQQTFYERRNAVANEPIRKATKETVQPEKADVECEIRIDCGAILTEDAQARIQSLVRREVQRIAEIAAVDVRDQQVAKRESVRLRNAPKERPHVFVTAGTNDPAAAVTLWQDKHGQLSEAPDKVRAFAKGAKS